MRRLPIFFLLDVSESMVGDNLRQLQQGLSQLVSQLRTDPHALETVFLSTIVFAGKARSLTPLTELAMFYPPRLPVGSGTSLGLALNHLMDEINRTVIKSTAEQKGDWKPVVYLMTDGKPTDDIQPALQRWQKDFAHQVTLVAIAIGQHASIASLKKFTEHVLLLDANTDADFKRFVDWVTLSVVAQSRSVAMSKTDGISLAKLDESILSKIFATPEESGEDESLVILTGRCQQNKLPYLIKYERMPQTLSQYGFKLDVSAFTMTGVYALENDYFDLSAENQTPAQKVNSDALIGSPGCPHCGNPFGFAMCSCGQIMCIKGDGIAHCPSCDKAVYFGASGADDEGFDVSRAKG